MSTYIQPTPIYLRIGERPEYHIGELRADAHGHINPQDLAGLLWACGEQLQSLMDQHIVEMTHGH